MADLWHVYPEDPSLIKLSSSGSEVSLQPGDLHVVLLGATSKAEAAGGHGGLRWSQSWQVSGSYPSSAWAAKTFW